MQHPIFLVGRGVASSCVAGLTRISPDDELVSSGASLSQFSRQAIGVPGEAHHPSHVATRTETTSDEARVLDLSHAAPVDGPVSTLGATIPRFSSVGVPAQVSHRRLHPTHSHSALTVYTRPQDSDLDDPPPRLLRFAIRPAAVPPLAPRMPQARPRLHPSTRSVSFEHGSKRAAARYVARRW